MIEEIEESEEDEPAETTHISREDVSKLLKNW
jgi:hypothetical protein